jgi:hypothetical protein
MPDNAFTLLALTGIGVSPYSARGLQQTLAPIAQATAQRRTVNGALKDLSFEGFRRYQSQITGNDRLPPVCDGLWPGRLVTVDCVAELSFVNAEGVVPQRTPVDGSERVEAGLTFYRPRLNMMVVSLTMQTDEYGAVVSWTLSLEEV